MAGHIALWVVLVALVIFFFAMASRTGRDVLDDQQIPRTDKQNEYSMSVLWVMLGAAAGVFLFIDAFSFFHPTPSSLNGVSTR
jgi:hypothetical protein